MRRAGLFDLACLTRSMPINPLYVRCNPVAQLANVLTPA
jgi:hypothetical protein